MFILLGMQITPYKKLEGFAEDIECAAMCTTEGPKCTGYTTKINKDNQTYICELISQSRPEYIVTEENGAFV